MRVQTKLLESNEMKKLLQDDKKPQYCQYEEGQFFKEIIDNEPLKKVYQNGVNSVLKSVFPQHWVEGNTEEMSGFYGVESEGRSVLNNLNTNYTTFCLLVKTVNKEIIAKKAFDKVFDFTKKEKRSLSEIERFLKALNHFKNKIFVQDNQDFINIIKVLIITWERGQKTEDKTISTLKKHFKNNISIEKVGKHGNKRDAYKGIDAVITLNGVKHTAQIKPFSDIEKIDGNIRVLGLGNVKPYKIDWLIFNNNTTGKVLVFKNNPISTENNYVFNEKSLLYEIG
jgi:hypothetical protein